MNTDTNTSTFATFNRIALQPRYARAVRRLGELTAKGPSVAAGEIQAASDEYAEALVAARADIVKYAGTILRAMAMSVAAGINKTESWFAELAACGYYAIVMTDEDCALTTPDGIRVVYNRHQDTIYSL